MNESPVKRNLSAYLPASSVTGRVDAWLSIALFSISLSCYYFHWQVDPKPDHDSTLLALYTQKISFLSISISSLGLVYIQALIFSVFGCSVASLQSITVGGALAAPSDLLGLSPITLGTVFARRAGLIAALGRSFDFRFTPHRGIAFWTCSGIDSHWFPVARFSARR